MLGMDVRKPRHDLRRFKASMRAKARISESALRTARLIGFGAADIVAFVQTMTQRDFVKSVTSLSDHRQWQDVYNVPHDGTTIYIKFTDSVVTEFVLLSFKEK
jgi:motility quorum-sensing regulator/GCU-specific mRNA interferase toxin